jgi:FHA domain/GYF domain 2
MSDDLGFGVQRSVSGRQVRVVSPPTAQNAWLISSLGHRIEVPANASLRVGREPDNSLTLDDNTVSRYHAVIEPAGQGFRVKDLGSSNGTFVNGRRIVNEPVFLERGDSIRFGNVSFQLQQELRPSVAGYCTKCGAGLREDSRLCPQCAARIMTRSDRSPGLSETSWYYERGGSRLGPVSASELVALCQRGDIEPDSVVWSPGLSTWRPLVEVKQFAEAISRPPSLPTTYVDNRAVWVLAVVPLFLPTLIALFVYSSGPGWTVSSAWWFRFWVFFCVNSGLIVFDHHMLKRSGHKPPQLWYLILIPLYLIMRSVKLRQTHAYTVVWFVTLLIGAPIARSVIAGLQ